MSHFLVYFACDKQFAVVTKTSIIRTHEIENERQWLTVSYDDNEYRAVVIQEGSLENLSSTLQYVRRLRFEKRLSIDVILKCVDRVHPLGRAKVLPLNVSTFTIFLLFTYQKNYFSTFDSIFILKLKRMAMILLSISRHVLLTSV
jgi:hypothetical protein